MEDEKNKIQSESEENTKKRLDQKKQIGKIIFSIHNIFEKCNNEKDCSYTGISIKLKEDIHDLNFDDIQKRGEIAISQMTKIKDHVVDTHKL